MGKKDKATQEQSFGAPAPATASSASSILGPLDVQQKEFRVSRFGGYKMRDVDEFLDRITDSMSALTVENERLRKGAPPSIVGTPDLADVSRQADEIIERARAEAARIVAEAKATGAQPAGGQPGAAASPQERAAVNAFLTREREFLQSLAGLVQEHAEQVRGMAKTAKRAPAPTDTPPAAPSDRGTHPEGGSGTHPARACGHDLTGVGDASGRSARRSEAEARRGPPGRARAHGQDRGSRARIGGPLGARRRRAGGIRPFPARPVLGRRLTERI